MRIRVSHAVLGALVAALVRLLGLTWRMRLFGHVDIGAHLFALLHGNLLLPAFRFRRSGAVIMIRRHRDGEIIAQAVERIGFRTVRGSSTRGAREAVTELLRDGDGKPWVITPDGPKGPRGSVKPGLIRLAATSGRAIHPVAGAARPARVFASWDRFVLPLPFARIALWFAEPLQVPRDVDDAEAAALAAEVERRLADAENKARAKLDSW